MHQPEPTVEGLVANKGQAESPVKALAAEGGGRWPVELKFNSVDHGFQAPI